MPFNLRGLLSFPIAGITFPFCKSIVTETDLRVFCRPEKVVVNRPPMRSSENNLGAKGEPRNFKVFWRVPGFFDGEIRVADQELRRQESELFEQIGRLKWNWSGLKEKITGLYAPAAAAASRQNEPRAAMRGGPQQLVLPSAGRE